VILPSTVVVIVIIFIIVISVIITITVSQSRCIHLALYVEIKSRGACYNVKCTDLFRSDMTVMLSTFFSSNISCVSSACIFMYVG